MRIDEAWLLTLPETDRGCDYQPACSITAYRSVHKTYYTEKESDYGPQYLTERKCIIYLHWKNGYRARELEFTATFTVDLLSRATQLDLTNYDFILDSDLRGRGLGSCNSLSVGLKHCHLICWSNPSGRKEDQENMIRRNRLWEGIGLQFESGGRRSLSLRAGDLMRPKGTCSLLKSTPLSDAVAELIKTRDQLLSEFKHKGLASKNLTKENAHFK